MAITTEFEDVSTNRSVGGKRISLRQQGSGTPPFPFPPPGESRGGRVPPTPGHVSCQPKALSRSVRRLPPQEGFQNAPLKSPLRIPLLACGSKEFYRGAHLTETGLLMEAVTVRERF